MDKRTLLFVFSLTLTLFGVNLYFESRNSDKMREWNQQQLAKKEETLKTLKAEAASRVAKEGTLPVVQLFSDKEGRVPVAYGVKSNGGVVAIAWSASLPKTIYAKNSGASGNGIALTLATEEPIIGEPVIYLSGEGSKLAIGELPLFGRYDLQLVVPEKTESGVSYRTVLGDYANGQLTIPEEKIAQIESEIAPGKEPVKVSVGEAIALIKQGESYVPVAVYSAKQRLLEPLDALSTLSKHIVKGESRQAPQQGRAGLEKFYVIETPYQQLVFSNVGGALAEINLPYESKEDKESVVKEIEFDRLMVKNHPYNAHFPSRPYMTPGENSSDAPVEHREGALGGYYPLIRRNLIQSDPSKSVVIQPRYYALNIVSEYPEMAQLMYEVKEFTKDKIVFEAQQGLRKITKTYSVASESQAPYAIDLTIKVEGESRGLWLTSGIPEVEWISGAPAPSLKFRLTRNQKSEVESIELPKDSITSASTYLDWISNSNGFLGMILDPLSDTDPGYRAQVVSGAVVPSRLVEIDEEYNRFNADNMPGYMTMLPLKSTGGTMHYRVYAGPFATNVLKEVDSVYSNPATGYNPDYLASQSFHGWFAFISEPFAKFLFILMNFFHSITGSWAFSIILLTVALRIMLYPLNAWSTKSMVKMQQISPQVTAIQERYKKDPKKAQVEIMNLYREAGVNPVSGCLPLLIQMPFLIGMFDLLKSTFELRGASFIPGWIDDLTAPDVLFSWNMPLPLIGNQFHLLPILLGVVMFLQQTMMSTLPKDRSLWTDQQRQQRFMGNIMAVVFAVMFYSFPSGLNIYWLSSMLLGMVQQYFTTKQMAKQTAAGTVTVLPAAKGKKKG